jgi:DNA-binding transcriptional LysR family regulator
LGVKLFRRSRRGAVLTDAGQSYHRQVAKRLDEVERDTLDLMARQGRGGTLELAVVPTFGTRAGCCRACRNSRNSTPTSH